LYQILKYKRILILCQSLKIKNIFNSITKYLFIDLDIGNENTSKPTNKLRRQWTRQREKKLDTY